VPPFFTVSAKPAGGLRKFGGIFSALSRRRLSMITAARAQSPVSTHEDHDDYLNGHSVAIVKYEGETPPLDDIPSPFEVLEVVEEGLDLETADAIAVAKSFEFLKTPGLKRWAVALPPGA